MKPHHGSPNVRVVNATGPCQNRGCPNQGSYAENQHPLQTRCGAAQCGPHHPDRPCHTRRCDEGCHRPPRYSHWPDCGGSALGGTTTRSGGGRTGITRTASPGVRPRGSGGVGSEGSRRGGSSRGGTYSRGGMTRPGPPMPSLRAGGDDRPTSGRATGRAGRSNRQSSLEGAMRSRPPGAARSMGMARGNSTRGGMAREGGAAREPDGPGTGAGAGFGAAAGGSRGGMALGDAAAGGGGAGLGAAAGGALGAGAGGTGAAEGARSRSGTRRGVWRSCACAGREKSIARMRRRPGARTARLLTSGTAAARSRPGADRPRMRPARGSWRVR